jgi:hypothetical protein
MEKKLLFFFILVLTIVLINDLPVFPNQNSQLEYLPIDSIQKIIGAQGQVENGVFHINISRKDIKKVDGPSGKGVTFTPDFVIDGDIFFQPIDSVNSFLNADYALKESEVNPFIAGLLKNNLTFQAFHQHLPTNPQIWFIHFRGKGDPVNLANGIRAAIKTTATPLPQTVPQNAKTTLDTAKLKTILRAQNISIGEKGVVTAWVYRSDTVIVDNVKVNPQANISTNINFKPGEGSQADVVVDFSMTAERIDTVVNLMLNRYNWFQGCLYNQETSETPQLYFDHMLKTGNAYDLAEQIRKGLDLTNSK